MFCVWVCVLAYIRGTVVNGKRVMKTFLSPNDDILIGDTHLKVRDMAMNWMIFINYDVG